MTTDFYRKGYDVLTKRILAAAMAATLLLALTAGCSKRKKQEVSEIEIEISRPSTVPSAELTPEANNANITESDYDLRQFAPVEPGDTIAIMETTEGTIRIKLFPDDAPKAVENFVSLAGQGYYNGVSFHRVLIENIIQGGDPTGTGSGGESIYAQGEGDPGYFENEYSLNLWNFRGAVGMANAGADTNTSQFYIVQRDILDDDLLERMREIQFPPRVIEKYIEVGGLPHQDWVQTVFGMVIDEESMEVVDAIAAVQVDGDAKPVEAVLIENVTIETATAESIARSAQSAEESEEASGAAAE